MAPCFDYPLLSSGPPVSRAQGVRITLILMLQRHLHRGLQPLKDRCPPRTPRPRGLRHDHSRVDPGNRSAPSHTNHSLARARSLSGGGGETCLRRTCPRPIPAPPTLPEPTRPDPTRPALGRIIKYQVTALGCQLCAKRCACTPDPTCARTNHKVSSDCFWLSVTCETLCLHTATFALFATCGLTREWLT